MKEKTYVEDVNRSIYDIETKRKMYIGSKRD